MKNIAERLEDELTYLAEIADAHPTAGQEFYRNYELLKDIQEERDALWHIVLLTRALVEELIGGKMSDLIADIEEYFSIGRGNSVADDLLERALTILKEQGE